MNPDTLLLFPTYTPPAITGEFNVVFSNSQYTEPRDTLTRKFVQTDYTWATDNLNLLLDGGAALNSEFATDLIYQVGALTLTGENGGTAQYGTFGIANIDSIYNPTNPAANLISFILYDADSDGNGDLNLLSDFQADLQSDVVGVGTYEMTGNEQETGLLDVLLIDNNGDTGVALIPNHPYYTTILYDGNENGTGQMPAFTNTAYVDYLFYSNESGDFVPSTPIMLGGQLSYWSDRTIVNRLQLEGYVTSTKQTGKVLDKSKYSVTPNPAGDNVRVNLELAERSDWVNVAIMSPAGKLLRSQNLSAFQSGQINLPARDIPAGNYLLWIRTPEGQAVTKLAIAH